MFVRIKSTPNSPRRSVQVVETYRKDDKVKQRIVRYVGIALNDEEEQKLRAMAEASIPQLVVEKAKKSRQPALFPLTEEDVKLAQACGRKPQKRIEDILPTTEVTLDDIEEESRIVEGVHEVAGELFDQMYAGILPGKRGQETLKDIVLARLIEPSSKRESQRILEQRFHKKHDLDAIYRMMDKIFPMIGSIKTATFNKTQSLFPQGVDMVLFDVTTLYFESVETDELRRFGYSKDHRFNTTQVVLALATNTDGLPVGYELFEGNKAEVSTLLAALESWKKLFSIQSVCFIGDRAMFSKQNVELIEEQGYHYVIAAKLKGLASNMQTQILESEHYRPALLAQQLAWIGEFDYQGQRLIVSYKSKRALKDQKDRQIILDKITKSLGAKGNPKKLISNKGVKQYIQLDDTASAKLDPEKIAQAARWDGLHGVITNLKDSSAESVIAKYARLWVIEESFRVNKHTLQMRPIYHWKPERIHSHIAICYMAFSLLRHLQYQVNLMQKVSINTIIDELLNVQASIHRHKKTKALYRLPGYFSNTARKIYKAMSVSRNLNAEPYLN